MTDITASRNIIQNEETRYRAAVSESTLTRVGASLNHVMFKQHDKHTFNFNGPYSVALGVGNDGMYIFNVDMEITYISMSNIVKGTSGVTSLDIHWLSGGGTDNGSIFSTKPSMDVTTPNNAYFLRDVVNSTTIATAAGVTIPTFTKTTFSAGDAIRCDLDTVMTNAQNLSLNLYFRPT